MTISSCGKRMNNNITLWRNDKIPYGTFYAYDNIFYLFENADVETSSTSPEYFDLDETSSAYIIIGRRVYPSENELNGILSHVYNGNKLFISSLNIGQNLLDSLGLKVKTTKDNYGYDSLTVNIDDLNGESRPFTYPGASMDSYFSEFDSTITNVIGTNQDDQANFIRISYVGGGAIFIHLAPTAFSNFFLLHKQNKEYYDLAFSSLSDSVDYVRWDDYFRHHINGQDDSKKSGFSMLSEILKNDALRWAFWLTLLLFTLIFIFESKRKQRIIPQVSKPDNTSVEFVEAVGRLYYNRRDNKNLAEKMISHFWGNIRVRYNLSTTLIDETFQKKLAFKSGCSIESINEIVNEITLAENKKNISDDELLHLNEKLKKFNKQT